MLRGTLFFIISTVAAWGGILNSSVVDPSLFRVTTYASGLQFPAGFQPLPDGSLGVETSPSFGFGQGQLLRFTDPLNTGVATGPGTVIYQSTVSGIMSGAAQAGPLYIIGNDGSRIGTTADHSFTLLQPGATPGSPMTEVASMHFDYAQPWEHDNIGMVARPTPGVPGSYDLIFNIGAQGDNTATPPDQQVTLTGTGFSSFPTANLHGDSLYMVTIDLTGAQPAVTSVKKVATGIRNVFGLAFDPATGDLYFADNAIDALPAGSTQPVQPDGEPPQADELNMISAVALGVGAPPDFGFPDCYMRYAYGGVTAAPVGSGCVMPIAAFQPVVDASGTHELEGPTQIALAPSTFPAGFNHGLFIGFTGENYPTDESGMGYYSLDTHQYVQFIQAGSGIHNIIGVASTANALFFADPGTGSVTEIAAAAPEPGTAGLMLVAIVAVGWKARRLLTSVR